jgi:hypothetical protein
MESTPVVTLTLEQRGAVRRNALFFMLDQWQARDLQVGASVPPEGYVLKFCRTGWPLLENQEQRACLLSK